MLRRLLGRELAATLRATPGIDANVAEAMIATRRHRFVRWRQLAEAYADRSLPTGHGTTISQPTYIGAVISFARTVPSDRVLEIGTGSGFTAAVLGRLAREVVSIERIPALAAAARSRLAEVANVRVIVGDGWHADGVTGTFDAIIVMCGAPSVPDALLALLRDRGRLVIPVGADSPGDCRLLRITRRGDHVDREDLIAGAWNPLVGADGWKPG